MSRSAFGRTDAGARSSTLSPCDVVTGDLSFISLVTVIPSLTGPILRDEELISSSW